MGEEYSLQEIWSRHTFTCSPTRFNPKPWTLWEKKETSWEPWDARNRWWVPWVCFLFHIAKAGSKRSYQSRNASRHRQNKNSSNSLTLPKDQVRGLLGSQNTFRQQPLLTGLLNMVKMFILPKLICGFNTILIKLSIRFVIGIDKIHIRFIWKGKKTKFFKSNFEKE